METTMGAIAQAWRASAALKLHGAETPGPIIGAILACVWKSRQQGGKL